MNTIPVELLREMFSYAPELGGSCLKRNKSRRSDRIGKMAGTNVSARYWTVQIGNKMFKAHRVVWALVKGEWPKTLLDHIDKDTMNNKIENLRECHEGMLDNMQNKKLYKNNRTGVQGVTPRTMRSGGIKYVAHIQVDNNFVWLGQFDTIEEAAEVRAAAKAKLHKFNPATDNQK